VLKKGLFSTPSSGASKVDLRFTIEINKKGSHDDPAFPKIGQ